MDNKNIVFQQNTAPIIIGILNKYQISETTQEVFEKMKQGKLLRGGIILDIIKRVILDASLQKNLANILQKELEISLSVANNVAADIKNQLLPIAKITTPTTTSQTPQITNKPESSTTTNNLQKIPPRKKLPTAKISNENIAETKPKANKPDKYRESI